jgi:hypothetical protein
MTASLPCLDTTLSLTRPLWIKNRVCDSALREDNLFLSILFKCSVSCDGEEHFRIDRRASAFLSQRQAPFEEVRQATEDP